MIEVLQKIHVNLRKEIKGITLDMAANIELIATRVSPNSTRVTAHFHVQKLATEALQEIRIKYRLEALHAENDAIEFAKKLILNISSKYFQMVILSNNYWPEVNMPSTKKRKTG